MMAVMLPGRRKILRLYWVDAIKDKTFYYLCQSN